MAKKAKPTDGAVQNGTAGSTTENSTAKSIESIDLEVVPNWEDAVHNASLSKSGKPLTFARLVANAEKARGALKKSAWEFAVAVTALHDSNLYPHADETDGFYTFMWEKWEYGRAQAANIVSWVKKATKIDLVLLNPALEDIKPKDINTLETPPPATPKIGKTASRGGKKTSSSGKGSSKKYYVIEDVDGTGKLSTRLITRKEADDKKLTTYSDLKDAERMLPILQKQLDDARQKKQEEMVDQYAPQGGTPPSAEEIDQMIDQFYPQDGQQVAGTRPAAELNPQDVVLDSHDVHRPGNYGWWSAIAEGQLGEETERFNDEVYDELMALCFKFDPHQVQVLDIMAGFVEDKRELLVEQNVTDVQDEQDEINESIS
jgi:hypothetical protein